MHELPYKNIQNPTQLLHQFICNSDTMMFATLHQIFTNIFFIIFLTNNLQSAMSAVPGNETDRSALMSFKAALTNDPLQSLSSWNETLHFCQWVGVTCGKKHNRVIEINLPAKQLTGLLSPFIGNLSFLKLLNLNDNSFTGEIPPEIARLSRLRNLSMTNNSLSATEIPSYISRCTNLEHIDLGGNSFIGTIPVEFQSLSKLKYLILFKNNLSGQIPDFLGNISGLVELSLAHNNFVGNIPSTLGGLSSLEALFFSINNLSGTIPPTIFNLSNLNFLDLGFNEIEGVFPSSLLLNFPKLRYLILASNRFTGLIPESVSNASQLVSLDLGINGFTGNVPNLNNLHQLEKLFVDSNSLGNGYEGDLDFFSSLSNNTNMKEIYFSLNNFGGTFPESIGNFSELMYLSMHDNPITGNIPKNIGELVKLEALGMNQCRFTGSIPNSIGNLREIKILVLEGNNLSGQIPPSLGNLTKMDGLDLSRNRLEGNIPSSLVNCIALSVLDLSKNNLVGQIPSGILSLPSLSGILDLSDNRLDGPLIFVEQVSRTLSIFSASSNLLSGEIPSNIGGYQSLTYLSLAGNLFHGVIPPSFSSLRGMEVLNLSRNNLSGEIPEYFGSFLFLSSLNLSFNDFDGAIPVRGVFSSASNFSINGNGKVCGGVRELNLPNCVDNRQISTKSRIYRRLKYIIPICIGIATLILVFVFVVVMYKRRHGKKVLSSPDDSVKDKKFRQLSYQDLHKATDGFSSANLCGSGKFSYVYKGVLDPDETTAAIKVLKLDVSGATRSFTAECEALRSIRHRNLVKIITSCSTIDFQGNEFKALVYVFMVNGSLENRLHHNSASLTLLERLNIVIDVASALDYLHNSLSTPIVHCDIKPSNVLLDMDFVAHLGDFGLLKFLQETSTVTDEDTSSVGIKGTLGYTPPEYGMGSDISTYGDVYSFGILILEIFSGKRPTDEMFNDELNLHRFVKMGIPNGVMKISDSRLMSESELQEMHGNIKTENGSAMDRSMECLVSMFRAGISCSMESPRERMGISDVVRELHFIKKTLVQDT